MANGWLLGVGDFSSAGRLSGLHPLPSSTSGTLELLLPLDTFPPLVESSTVPNAAPFDPLPTAPSSTSELPSGPELETDSSAAFPSFTSPLIILAIVCG
ncbi:hypothetical protein D3C78_1089490 [compost metagenome]